MNDATPDVQIEDRAQFWDSFADVTPGAYRAAIARDMDLDVLSLSETFKTPVGPGPYADGMYPRLDLIGIVSSDMARSLAFYRLLGLDLPAEADGDAHVEVALPGGMRLAWDTVEVITAIDPGWTAPTGGHRVALAFDCGAPAQVDAVYATLVEAGAVSISEPQDQFWGQRYAVVSDPDGNAVDLFAPLPG